MNAKLDRLDRLQGGAHAILDYKTGEASIAGWLGERPDEPQLPLYAVTSGTDVAVVAFARVRTGEKKPFRGIARKKGLIPDVDTLAEQRLNAAKRYRSWDELLSGWRRELEALGREFASGEARVAPKDERNVCVFFTPRTTVERQTSTPAGKEEAPTSSARRAFDDLFK